MPGVQPEMHSGELFYPGAHNGPDVSNLNRNSCEQRGCGFRVSRKFCLGVREHLTGSGFGGKPGWSLRDCFKAGEKLRHS